MYLVAAHSTGARLIRLAGANRVASWRLDFAIGPNSYAFVTDWGRLKIVTKDAIAGCDLATLGNPDTTAACDVAKGTRTVSVNNGETPAMGPDGSLYLKNVEAAGSVVAYNPSLQEIWRTDLLFTKVSPISLSANGRYAYVLADIAVQEGKRIALVGIDTATGDKVQQEIINPDQSKPLLSDLFRPAVTSKINGKDGRLTEYVFVAGNTNATGVLQLLVCGQDAEKGVRTSKRLWSRSGKVATAPVLSVVDGNSVYVVQDGSLKRYLWNSANGAYEDSAVKEHLLGSDSPGLLKGVRALLVDGADSLYLLDVKSQNRPFLAVYNSAHDWQKADGAQVLRLNANMLPMFTTDGALIGYDNSQVEDLKPQSTVNTQNAVNGLADKTIYSEESVTVSTDAAKQLELGNKVILKGRFVKLPKGFRWPRGKTLKLQTVPKAS